MAGGGWGRQSRERAHGPWEFDFAPCPHAGSTAPLPCFSDPCARTSGVFFTAVPGAKDCRQGALRSSRERPAQGAAGRRAGLRHQLHGGPAARPLVRLAHQGHPRGAPAAVPKTDLGAQLPQLMGRGPPFAKYLSASRGSRTQRRPAGRPRAGRHPRGCARGRCRMPPAPLSRSRRCWDPSVPSGLLGFWPKASSTSQKTNRGPKLTGLPSPSRLASERHACGVDRAEGNPAFPREDAPDGGWFGPWTCCCVLRKEL